MYANPNSTPSSGFVVLVTECPNAKIAAHGCTEARADSLSSWARTHELHAQLTHPKACATATAVGGKPHNCPAYGTACVRAYGAHARSARAERRTGRQRSSLFEPESEERRDASAYARRCSERTHGTGGRAVGVKGANGRLDGRMRDDAVMPSTECRAESPRVELPLTFLTPDVYKLEGIWGLVE